MMNKGALLTGLLVVFVAGYLFLSRSRVPTSSEGGPSPVVADDESADSPRDVPSEAGKNSVPVRQPEIQPKIPTLSQAKKEASPKRDPVPPQGTVPRQVPAPPGLPYSSEIVGRNSPYYRRVLPRPTWTQNERKLPRVAKDREVEDFVKSVRAKNLGPYIVSAGPYVAPQSPSPSPSSGAPVSPGPTSEGKTPEPTPVERLWGKYDGEIRFDDGKKVWQIALELSGGLDEKGLKGQSLVEISENGVVVSKTTQSGELSLLKKPAEDSVGILLTPTDTYSLQLYYVKDRDLLVGNYYVKKEPGEYVPQGTVRLARRPPSIQPAS